MSRQIFDHGAVAATRSKVPNENAAEDAEDAEDALAPYSLEMIDTKSENNAIEYELDGKDGKKLMEESVERTSLRKDSSAFCNWSSWLSHKYYWDKSSAKKLVPCAEPAVIPESEQISEEVQKSETPAPTAEPLASLREKEPLEPRVTSEAVETLKPAASEASADSAASSIEKTQALPSEHNIDDLLDLRASLVRLEQSLCYAQSRMDRLFFNPSFEAWNHRGGLGFFAVTLHKMKMCYAPVTEMLHYPVADAEKIEKCLDDEERERLKRRCEHTRCYVCNSVIFTEENGEPQPCKKDSAKENCSETGGGSEPCLCDHEERCQCCHCIECETERFS